MAAGQPLRGFVGQLMGGRKGSTGLTTKIAYVVDKATGSGTITSPNYSTICHMFVWGGGGGGKTSSQAGGGGGAAYKRLRMGPGRSMSYAVGAGGPGDTDGGTSSITIPGLL